jgi:hypothetical protein
MKKLLLTALLAASAVQINAAIIQFNLKGTAGSGLLPASEPSLSVPSTASGGEIGAGITYDDVANVLVLTNIGWGSSKGFTDLTSPANNSHIHGPTATNYGNGFTQTAGVQFSLTRSSNLATGGNFTANVTLSEAQETDLLNGKYYINIHTTGNGGGEMRGFLIPVFVSIPASISLAAQISWLAATNINYQVQGADVLNSNVWFNLGGQIAGNNATNHYYDPIGNLQTRYYRVLTQP